MWMAALEEAQLSRSIQSTQAKATWSCWSRRAGQPPRGHRATGAAIDTSIIGVVDEIEVDQVSEELVRQVAEQVALRLGCLFAGLETRKGSASLRSCGV
jgi:hypothetical protein